MRNVFKSVLFSMLGLRSLLVMNSGETSFPFLLFFSFALFAGRIPEVREYPGDAIMMEATFIYVRQNGGPFLSLSCSLVRVRNVLLFSFPGPFLLSFRQVTD